MSWQYIPILPVSAPYDLLPVEDRLSSSSSLSLPHKDPSLDNSGLMIYGLEEPLIYPRCSHQSRRDLPQAKRGSLLPGTGTVRAPFWFGGAPKARLGSLQARGGEGALQMWGPGHTP